MISGYEIALRFPPGFRFPSVVFSHGWSILAPFSVTDTPLGLSRVLAIRKNALVRTELRHRNGRDPSVLMFSASDPSLRLRGQVAARLLSITQADLDLTPFYERVRGDKNLAWSEDAGAGRMLRGESFFEDAVKTILTTNCSWSLTTSMNNNLILHFGPKNAQGIVGFPTPEAIAGSSAGYLRKECRLGYRSEYVFELAVRCAKGELDLEQFRRSNAPAGELFAELRGIKGIGEYAAANLMRMLGKFDYLGLDSWCRNKIAELHGNGTPLSGKDIEKLYAMYDEWKGLAMWLDVTRHWYLDKFPLT